MRRRSLYPSFSPTPSLSLTPLQVSSRLFRFDARISRGLPSSSAVAGAFHPRRITPAARASANKLVFSGCFMRWRTRTLPNTYISRRWASSVRQSVVLYFVLSRGLPSHRMKFSVARSVRSPPFFPGAPSPSLSLALFSSILARSSRFFIGAPSCHVLGAARFTIL